MKPDRISYGDYFVHRESRKPTEEVLLGLAPELSGALGEIRAPESGCAGGVIWIKHR
jgi:hypothetical protein